MQLRAKVAPIVATAVFAFGAAGGHIYQLIANKNHAVNNTGLLLVMDIVGIACAAPSPAVRRSLGCAPCQDNSVRS